MGDKDDKDTRGLGDIIGDIEKHIDEVERGSKPAPKKPATPGQKPAPIPERPASRPAERPASAPQADAPKKDRKEVDEETLEKLARVREVLDQQDPLIRRSKRRTRVVLLLGIFFVIVILGFVYFLSSDRIDMPFDQDDMTDLDPSAPADSRTGDQYEKERKKLHEALPKVSAGNPEGIRELRELVDESPTSPQAAEALGVLATTYRYKNQNHTEAIKAYRELLDKFPDHRDAPRTRKYFIEYLVQLGRTKEAKEQAEILVEEAKDPKDKAMAEAILKQIP